ncbi:hypothetical protein ACY2C9_07890 [Staphylococcus simulans]
MSKLKTIKIALLIVILAEEIKSAIAGFRNYFNLKKCPKCDFRTIKSAKFCPYCRYKFN